MKSIKVFVVICIILMMGLTGSNSDSSFAAGEEDEALDNVSRPARKIIAVEGVVYCKLCKFLGVDTLLGASPLAGAVGSLRCNNSRRGVTAQGKTDKNGYFFILTANVTSYGAHKCKLFLVSSPSPSCNNATDINGRLTGGRLRFHRPLKWHIPVALFSRGLPFAFGPSNTTVCTR